MTPHVLYPVPIIQPDGSRRTVFVALPGLGPEVSQTEWTIGASRGAADTVRYLDDFRLHLQRAWIPGEEVLFVEPRGVKRRRIFSLGIGQSNTPGRGHIDLAVPYVNAGRIVPAGFSYDRNPDGPGTPFIVGPQGYNLDGMLSARPDRWTHGCILCTATGGNSIEDLLGPSLDGTDGTFATQRDSIVGSLNPTFAGAGIWGANPPPILRPGDEYVIWFGQGEANTAAGDESQYAARVLTLLNYAISCWPLSRCVCIFVVRLPPSEPGDVARPNWQPIRAHQLSLEAPGGLAPYFVPIVVVDAIDADRQLLDPIHYETWGQIRQAAAGVRRARELRIF